MGAPALLLLMNGSSSAWNTSKPRLKLWILIPYLTTEILVNTKRLLKLPLMLVPRRTQSFTGSSLNFSLRRTVIRMVLLHLLTLLQCLIKLLRLQKSLDWLILIRTCLNLMLTRGRNNTRPCSRLTTQGETTDCAWTSG